MRYQTVMANEILQLYFKYNLSIIKLFQCQANYEIFFKIDMSLFSEDGSFDDRRRQGWSRGDIAPAFWGWPSHIKIFMDYGKSVVPSPAEIKLR